MFRLFTHHMIVCLVAVIGFAAQAAALEFSKGKWIDLTHPFNEESVYWPTADEFKKTSVHHGHTEGGWFYSANNFSATEHGGTHMDAPIHFAEGT